jgi:hypothetical protein
MDKNNEKRTNIVSRVFEDGRIAELIYEKAARRTKLAVWDGSTTKIVESVQLEAGLRLAPVPASNSLIRHEAVRLPEAPAPYGDVAILVAEIEAYLARYVVLSDWFRSLAAYYALFTWVYDAFQEVPYLRVHGEWGSGKTRALLVIGSICYRAFFASGASTVSPIFHTLDTFRGTLVLDESDFRFSDQTAELTKILNNGTVRGFPVFRTAITKDREFDPRAFQVYGPKLVAMRKSFADDALESRFITERMDAHVLRKEIPLNLPGSQEVEARLLRNKLLQYRFDHRMSAAINEALVDPNLSPRLNQILIPLLSVVPDASARAEIRAAVAIQESERRELQSETPEGLLAALLAEQSASGEAVFVSELAAKFAKRFDPDAARPVSPRYVGSLLRTRLGLKTYKSNGTYLVKINSNTLAALQARYGIVARGSAAPETGSVER